MARSTKFYQVSADSDAAERFHVTLAAARKAAREAADYTQRPVEIERVEAGTAKADLVRLANGSGWCMSAEVIEIVQPRWGKS